MDLDIKCKIKEKKAEKPKTDMTTAGHPAASATIVIPRTFRWTLVNENHPDIHWWMKTIKTDYVAKKITIEVMDDAKGTIFNWIQALVEADKSASTLTLTHLDGCGTPISLINFINLKIEDHITAYDYGNSDILTHKLVISYSKIKRVNELNIN